MRDLVLCTRIQHRSRISHMREVYGMKGNSERKKATESETDAWSKGKYQLVRMRLAYSMDRLSTHRSLQVCPLRPIISNLIMYQMAAR